MRSKYTFLARDQRGMSALISTASPSSTVNTTSDCLQANKMATTQAPEQSPMDSTQQLKPQEISFPLPKALHTTAHVHLTFLETCAMVFLSTTTPGDSAGSVASMGSFVYAMPDVSVCLTDLPLWRAWSLENLYHGSDMMSDKHSAPIPARPFPPPSTPRRRWNTRRGLLKSWLVVWGCRCMWGVALTPLRSS